MAKEQKVKQHAKDVDEETEVEPKDLESDIDVDDLLDEIDKVLESNEEEFVQNYIQKGGQ
jgi:ubiquitin-like protein Pup